ncbi:MAG: fatty acyl-AMP ligase [Deltaproteobacteria bacterium]|nr:fatty acyl-AMP ligase [Deltaproteobacteria bacterium]
MQDEVSRVFRSSFPDVERTDFRTGSWRVQVPRGADELNVHHSTVLHAFATAAKLEDKIGVTLLRDDEDEPEEFRTYKKLYEQSKLLSSALDEMKIKRGDRVLIVLPTSFEFILAFFAVPRLGAIPVPSYPPALLEKAEVALDRITHIGNHSRATVCLTNRLLLPLMGSLARKVDTLHDIVAVEKLLEHRATSAPKARATASDSAFIQYTSGSTGNPKGVLLSHHNLVANIHAAGLATRVNRNDRVVSWLPLYHDMGLIGGMLFAFYWRLPLVLLSPNAFLLAPGRWLWAIHKHKGTLTAAPNFAFALCIKRVRPRDRVGLDLSSWRCALNGAEPVNHKTVLEFTQAFAPNGFRAETMFPVYGLAESTVAVTFPHPGDPLRTMQVDRQALAEGFVKKPTRPDGEGTMTLVQCGHPVPGHDVGIVDAEGNAVQRGEVGHLIVRGPSVMQGYFEDAKATRGVLRDGWLWTGDLGFRDETGGLYITGRAKDIIILRGKNYYAEDLERVIEHVPGVRPGGAVAFAVYDEDKASDLVVTLCETKLEDEAERTKLVAAVSDAVLADCGVRIDEVVLIPPGTIPKTGSGKRQRALSRERYLKDELLQKKPGRLQLALVFVRSGRGFLSLLKKQLERRLRAPD